MAVSCKQVQEWVEEKILQPINDWIRTTERTCASQPCKWWCLCCNKWFCWLVVLFVKIVTWVTTIFVRTVFRTICSVVAIAIGLVTMFWDGASILSQGITDLIDSVQDAIHSTIGRVVYGAIRLIDAVQSVFRLQKPKRPLTPREYEILYMIYRDAINYDLIRIVDGPAALLTVFSGHTRAFTITHTIYMPQYTEDTLVHESVHVWQFEHRGFQYLGSAAVDQVDSSFISKAYDPYYWKGKLDAGESWFTLRSTEAQAQFIQDIYTDGAFIYGDPTRPPSRTPGSFFLGASGGTNSFLFRGGDYTAQANAAWNHLRSP